MSLDLLAMMQSFGLENTPAYRDLEKECVENLLKCNKIFTEDGRIESDGMKIHIQ